MSRIEQEQKHCVGLRRSFPVAAIDRALQACRHVMTLSQGIRPMDIVVIYISDLFCMWRFTLSIGKRSSKTTEMFHAHTHAQTITHLGISRKIWYLVHLVSEAEDVLPRLRYCDDELGRASGLINSIQIVCSWFLRFGLLPVTNEPTWEHCDCGKVS